jgi:hypothetical protein
MKLVLGGKREKKEDRRERHSDREKGIGKKETDERMRDKEKEKQAYVDAL